MEISLKRLLVIHIASGFTALLSGLLAMAVVKGGKTHRKAGKIFFVSMLAVTASAFVISILKNNQFLLLIAIFSFYNNYFGYRAIKNKKLSPSTLDWVVVGFGTLNTFFMIYSMNIVLMVFGVISLTLVIRNCLTFMKVNRGEKLPELAWLKFHIGMMMGAYTATITAFVVVNSSALDFLSLPNWLPWFLPGVILAPLSAYFTRKYTVTPLGKSDAK